MRSLLFLELLGGMGDLLIALPAIQALARSHPEAQLTVITLAPGAALLAHDPLITRVVVAPKHQASQPHAIRDFVARFLGEQTFDLIVTDTTYDDIGTLVEQSGAGQSISNLWRHPPDDERVGDRFIHLLLEEGAILPAAVVPARLHLSHDELRAAGERLGAFIRPLVYLFPACGMAIKRWSEASYIALGGELQRRFDATIVVPTGAGGVEDERAAERVARAIGGRARVHPAVALRDLAALLAHGDLFVAADTGAARIAATLGVPTITLFGPSWHGRYGEAPPHLNPQGYAACPERVISNFTVQRCWYSGVCPLGPWRTCLEAISVDEVLVAAEQLLATRVQALRPPDQMEGPQRIVSR